MIQNSRHYKKISGDAYGGFDLIRLPMYKYSKLVKEKFFNDNFMAFYWMIFKQQNDIESLLKNENGDDENEDDEDAPTKPDLNTIIQIVSEFDHLAMETLVNGIPQLYNYIIGPQLGSFQTATGDIENMTPMGNVPQNTPFIIEVD